MNRKWCILQKCSLCTVRKAQLTNETLADTKNTPASNKSSDNDEYHSEVLMECKYDHLSPVTSSHGLSAGRKSTGLSHRPGATIASGVQHKAKPHHAWNVTQLQVKAQSFVPLDRSLLRVSLLRTVDTRTQVLAAMVQ